MSEALEDNDTNRIDSEYFKKEYLFIDELINKHSTAKLGTLCTWVTQGPNPIFSEEGIPCLTGRNIKTGQVDYYDSDIIDPYEYEKLKRFTIKLNDILITLKGKGSIGKIGLVIDTQKSIFSRDVGLIRINSALINPLYVYVFLTTKFGSKIIAKGETGGTGQSTLTTSFLKQIDIPLFSHDFQNKIEATIMEAHQKYDDSNKIYVEAEKLLTTELGLNDFCPSIESVAIKSFSESFGVSGRFDAEYYQPKYDEIVTKIKTYKMGYKALGEIALLKKSIEPGSDAYGDEGVQFLRVSDLFKHELKEPEIRLSETLFDSKILENLKPKKGEVLLSKDGSVGIAYAMQEDANFIPSGAIVRLQQLNNFLPDVLALLLNSQVVQLQAERDAGGSIIQHWKPSEINEILLPLIDENIQKIIADKISESFTLRAESKRLLEEAKTAVERAIEDGKTAI